MAEINPNNDNNCNGNEEVQIDITPDDAKAREIVPVYYNPYEEIKNGKLMVHFYTMMICMIAADFSVKEVQSVVNLNKSEVADLCKDVINISRECIKGREIFAKLFVAIQNFINNISKGTAGGFIDEIEFRANINHDKLTKQDALLLINMDEINKAVNELENLRISNLTRASEAVANWAKYR